MEKVASNAELSPAALANITAFSFGLTLASPAYGLDQQKVASHTKRFTDRIKVASSRIKQSFEVLTADTKS